MIKNIFRIITLLALAVGLLPSAHTAQAAPATGASPEAYLNPDGTINLDGSFSGSFDLSGWDVSMDAQRGPVFSKAGATVNTPAVGNWENLGAGGAPLGSEVYAIVAVGTDVYVGGNFHNAGGIPEADYIARWDGSAWHSLSSNNQGNGALNGVVTALCYDGVYLYVGGAFGDISASNGAPLTAADYIARWDGSTWSALGSNGAANGSLNGQVNTIIANGSLVYVGGYFTDVNNSGQVFTEADYLTAWDGVGWQIVGKIGSGIGALNNPVWDLATDGSTLYIGGQFTDAADITEADYVVVTDNNTWWALGSNGAGNGAFDNANYVSALALNSTGQLYVGGSFTDVNNGLVNMPDADRLVKWDGSNWSAVGTNGVANSINGIVNTILIDAADNVYVGGNFTNVNNKGTSIPTADRVAKWDGTNWSALGSDGAGDGAISKPPAASVYALYLDGSNLYVGGYFEDVNNGGTVLPFADFLSVWNVNHWEALPASTNGVLTTTLYNLNQISALAVSGTNLYVGGNFADVPDAQGVNMTDADMIARWDGVQWSSMGTSSTGSALTLFVDGSDLYVGGSFLNMGGVDTADYLAKWDGTTWSGVGNNGAGNGSLNSTVRAIAKYNGELYVGGSFTTATNTDTTVVNAAYLARWNGSVWNAVETFNSGVFALKTDSNGLYIGGGFTDVGGNLAADYVVRWDGTAITPLGSQGGNGPIQGYVYALDVIGTNVYVGGLFGNANGIPQADNIARWDGAAWHALGSDAAGTNGSISGNIYAITHAGNKIFVGGQFIDVSDSSGLLLTADFVASWDGAHWSALGSNGTNDGSLKQGVNVLAVGDALYVGGKFLNVSNNGVPLPAADLVASYGIDLTPPTVSSINRAETSPSAAAALDFTVTFSESVSGVDASDFTLTQTGSVSGATVSGLSGSGSSYTVTVNTGSGDGTIRLDLNASGTGIVDGVDLAIAGGFASGQVYTIKKSTTFKSDGANDGWILESGENTNAGSTMNSSATTFNLGDDSARKQYRAILSFDTSSLPDNATITKVTLKIKKQGLSGTDPFTILGGLTVDMRKPSFGALTLGLTDFQSAAGRTAVATFGTTPVINWYSAILNASGKNYVNKAGVTQFRLRFATDDNNNAIADFMKFFSGNAAAGARPQLIVEYKVP